MKETVLNFVHAVTWMSPSNDLEKSQDFEDYFNLTLKDEEGDGYSWYENKEGFKCSPNEDGARLKIAQFPLSIAQLNNAISQEFTNRHIALLMDEDEKKDLLLNYGKLEAVVLPKTKGDTFIASEFTKEVFDESKNEWVTAIPNKEYLVYRNGWRFDYDSPFNLTFDIPRKDKKEIKEDYLEQLAELEANEIERRKTHKIQLEAKAKAEAEAKAKKEAEKKAKAESK